MFYVFLKIFFNLTEGTKLNRNGDSVKAFETRDFSCSIDLQKREIVFRNGDLAKTLGHDIDRPGPEALKPFIHPDDLDAFHESVRRNVMLRSMRKGDLFFQEPRLYNDANLTL